MQSIPKTPIAAITNRSQSGIKIIRQANGEVYMSCIACVAVVNRVGEIDSRALFDDFITRNKIYNSRPALLFHHISQFRLFRLGEVVDTFREGYSYVAIARFDTTNNFARMVADEIEHNPQYWGISIGYKPEGEPELMRDKDGQIVEVYTRGFNHEISILPEESAASYFTKILQGRS